MTPLHYASTYGHRNVIEYLLDKNMDIDLPDIDE